jgi:23S rRNA (cytosine1962-C5)-methyltransferase
VRVSQRGADRWKRGHPWIFASDVKREGGPARIASVAAGNGRPLGQALYSPTSEIRLRLLEPDPDRPIDRAWWRERLAAAARRREGIDATAYRVAHAEGDLLPSLVVDRYDRWIVAQLLSAGLESVRPDVIGAIEDVLAPEGILLRNDGAVRQRERLPRSIEVVSGSVPEEIEVREGGIRYLVSPRTGQKTGAFLDQRPARLRAGALMPPGGRGLDCFSYHGSFGLHLAARAGQVLALDVSAEALTRGAANARLNGLDNIEWREADAFDALRDLGRAGERFDLVVVDPPAFAKSRAALPKAIRGYKDVNLHAMRLVRPGGILLTASCSFHLRWPDFLALLADAAADAGRRVTVREHLTQGVDHPELLTVPETGYLKGAVLAVD